MGAILCCGVQASHCGGFSCSRAWLYVWGLQWLQLMGSAAVTLRASFSIACGLFLDQGSNPCPLHWQVDSYPLHQQGGLPFFIFVPSLQQLKFGTHSWAKVPRGSCGIHHQTPKGPGGASPTWALDSGQTGLSTSHGTSRRLGPDSSPSWPSSGRTRTWWYLQTGERLQTFTNQCWSMEKRETGTDK